MASNHLNRRKPLNSSPNQNFRENNLQEDNLYNEELGHCISEAAIEINSLELFVRISNEIIIFDLF